MGPYCLQEHLQRRQQMTKVMTGGKRFNYGSRSQFFVGRKEKNCHFWVILTIDDHHIIEAPPGGGGSVLP